MSLAPFVHAMARGPARARNLTRDEAREAMALILSGNAAPEAIGALFMLMRYRGETAEEIAGFVDAMRAHVPSYGGLCVDVDWPSYAAGRSRGLPLCKRRQPKRPKPVWMQTGLHMCRLKPSQSGFWSC